MTAVLTTDVDAAARFLHEGKLVAFATETVYGLGANALDVNAVARVFEAKGRPHFDPLIIHLSEADEIGRVVSNVPVVARKLIEKFWPGPLTLVLPRQSVIPDLVTAGLPSVAVRVPGHPQARELIRKSGVPVAAPSANPFGRISPTTASHVMQHLGDRIDMVLEGGACRIGVESTVLQILPGDIPRLLRPGGLSREEIEAEIGPVLFPEDEADDQHAQLAPGRLLKHYAPRKKLLLVEDWSSTSNRSSSAALTLQPFPAQEEFGSIEILSPTGNLLEAAAGFFAALRRLDEDSSEVIYATKFPDYGLGLALNDRLIRAAR